MSTCLKERRKQPPGEVLPVPKVDHLEDLSKLCAWGKFRGHCTREELKARREWERRLRKAKEINQKGGMNFGMSV